MPFKTVFVPVALNQEESALDRAVEIGAALDAHLSVVVYGLAPPPPASPYGVVSSDIWAREITDGQAAVEARVAEIRERFGQSAPSVQVEAQFVDRGAVPSSVGRYARYSDMTLIFPLCTGFDMIADVVSDGALFESSRPLVLMPEARGGFPDTKRIIVAWDASLEASRAVRDSIELMSRAERVDLVMIDPVPSVDGHGEEPGVNLAAYLARHGITTEIHCLPSQGRDVSGVLRRTASDLGAELIVMGGYGHSRLRQRFLGGTTVSMLRDISVPILMSH